MKKQISVIGLLLISFALHAQVLLEDKDGQVIVRNQFELENNVSMIKLNTGEQSLGFNYITSNRLFRPGSYRINEFGIKAKPTEGLASVISNGQFSPGVKITYALTKVKIFSQDPFPNKAKFFDWGGVELNYEINKYALYKADTTFNNQFYSKTFRPLSLSLFYNYLVTTGELNSKFLISFKAGYSRKSTFDELKSVDAQDILTITDPTSTISRQSLTKKSGKSGKYEEYDAFPMILSFTFLTKTDHQKKPNPAYRVTRKEVNVKVVDTVLTHCPPTPTTVDSIVVRRDSAIRNGLLEITITRDTLQVTRNVFTNCDPVLRVRESTSIVYDTANAEKELPNPDVKKLRLGCNIYLKNIAGSNRLPDTKLGAIFFLTKQDTTGIRSPVFGINIQADDPFDVKKINNGLQSRVSIGFTSIFTL